MTQQFAFELVLLLVALGRNSVFDTNFVGNFVLIVVTERGTVAFGKVSVNERKTCWDIWRSDIF